MAAARHLTNKDRSGAIQQGIYHQLPYKSAIEKDISKQHFSNCRCQHNEHQQRREVRRFRFLTYQLLLRIKHLFHQYSPFQSCDNISL